MKKIVGITLSVVLVIAIGIFGYFQYFVSDNEELTYVTIDINPSIQLGLNADEEVVEVIPLNDDGDILLSGLDLKGLTLDEATEQVIDTATETGYIDEFGEDNVVAITAYTEDEETRTAIENKVIEKAKNVLEGRKIYSEVVPGLMTDELKAEAEQYDISNGKMLLIEKATLLDNSLSKDDLVNLSVKDIQSSIREIVETRYEVKEMNKEQFQEFAEEQNEIRMQVTEEKKETIIEDLKKTNQDRIEKAGEANEDKVIEDLIKEKKEQIRESAVNKKTVDQDEDSSPVDNQNGNANENSSNGQTDSGNSNNNPGNN